MVPAWKEGASASETALNEDRRCLEGAAVGGLTSGHLQRAANILCHKTLYFTDTDPKAQEVNGFPRVHGWGSQTQNSNASPLNGKGNL